MKNSIIKPMIRIKLIIENVFSQEIISFRKSLKYHFYVKNDRAEQFITNNDFSLSLPYILAKKERSIF